ncbi:MAG: YkgJ family cysteine cluster protein [Bacteroidota bacterium]|nr:YkgJ family cysteine cluster protein [Bacteroidota bacterium]
MSILNEIDLSGLQEKALQLQLDSKAFFKKLKKKKPKNLDDIVHQYHYEAFNEINCLDCANCCKSISPTLYNKDIERLSKALKIKPSDFVEKYLNVDSDNDYVFKETPCPFLLPDNYCIVYENRPKACREYPHTDRKKFYQLINLSLKNTEICPAVYDIINRLKDNTEL